MLCHRVQQLQAMAEAICHRVRESPVARTVHNTFTFLKAKQLYPYKPDKKKIIWTYHFEILWIMYLNLIVVLDSLRWLYVGVNWSRSRPIWVVHSGSNAVLWRPLALSLQWLPHVCHQGFKQYCYESFNLWVHARWWQLKLSNVVHSLSAYCVVIG